MSAFDSEGFDLDAVQENSDNVVLEIGGGASVDKPVEAPKKKQESDGVDPDLQAAMDSKNRGNEAFRGSQWLDAYDHYTEAIEVTPGEPKGAEIRGLHQAWLDERRQQMRADLEKQDEERRKAKERGEEEPKSSTPDPRPFLLDPQHPHAEVLATFYCNRAATLLHLTRHEEAKDDCDIAIWLNPNYVKAYVRRSNANSNLEDTEAALKDAQAALKLDPSNRSIRASVQNLEKIEAERLEKLKEETLGKLKDLGNSILGNFGLSLDNFQTTQDPNTGSYSINFNQNNPSDSSK